jgi:hypothetical protein
VHAPIRNAFPPPQYQNEQLPISVSLPWCWGALGLAVERLWGLASFQRSPKEAKQTETDGGIASNSVEWGDDFSGGIRHVTAVSHLRYLRWVAILLFATTAAVLLFSGECSLLMS